MREAAVCALFLLCAVPAQGQAVPPGWLLVRDTKSACQIAVPPEWSPLGENTGAAVFKATETAIAVVTVQSEQKFEPLTQAVIRLLGLSKDKIFENSSKRIFYQDRVADKEGGQNSLAASVPGSSGTCSCRVSFVSEVSEETAKKIALSLGPAPPQQQQP